MNLINFKTMDEPRPLRVLSIRGGTWVGPETKPLLRKKQTNVDRFYEWLIKCGNVHLSNDEQVVNAFNKIPI